MEIARKIPTSHAKIFPMLGGRSQLDNLTETDMAQHNLHSCAGLLERTARGLSGVRAVPQMIGDHAEEPDKEEPNHGVRRNPKKLFGICWGFVLGLCVNNLTDLLSELFFCVDMGSTGMSTLVAPSRLRWYSLMWWRLRCRRR